MSTPPTPGGPSRMGKMARARLPAAMDQALRRLASRMGQTRSELVRAMLARGLADAGVWPPGPAGGSHGPE